MQSWGVDMSVWETTPTNESHATDVQDDDFDPDTEKVEAVCKKGDIWQLGNHRLMCGDSTVKDDVDKLMDGEKADMCFTDPPYGVSIGDKNALLNKFSPHNRIEKNINNDNIPIDELTQILTKAMTNIRLACKDDAAYYLTVPSNNIFHNMLDIMKKVGLEF